MKRIIICLSALIILIGSFTAIAAAAAPEPAGPEYPEILSITPGATGFTIKWSAYNGAAKYRLFIKNGTGWKTVGETAGTQLSHKDLEDCASYTYTVRALNSKGKYSSRYNAEGWTKVFYAPPKITSAAPAGDAVRIKWNKTGTGWWRVYRLENGAWQSLGFSDSDSFIDENVVSGSEYTYTVRRYSEDKKEKTSSYNKTGVTVRFVAVPGITGASSGNGYIRLKIRTSQGAEKYRLFIQSGTKWKKLGDTASDTFDYRPGSADFIATFTVRAVDKSGAFISDYDKAGFTHKHLSNPGPLSVTNVFGGQKISWKSNPLAEKCRVYQKENGAWKVIGEVTGTSFTAAGVNNGEERVYTVRYISAQTGAAQSYYDRAGIGAVYYEAPLITAVENAAQGALISWTGAEGVSIYRVFADVNGKWKKIGDARAVSYLHDTAEDGKSYRYTVRAIDKQGRYLSGYDPEGYTNTFYAPPEFTSIVPGSSANVLNWAKRDGVAGFRVYRRPFTGNWKRIAASVNGTSYTDRTAPKNVPYQYTLRCLDENGNTISYYLTDTLYYYNGAVANGKIVFNGHTLNFKDGRYLSGYVSAQDIADVALAEVGYKATYLKKCKYNTWYWGREVSGDMYDWCGVFVNWVFNEAGAYDILKTKSANCGMMGADFKRAGILVTSDYRVGDVAFFSYGNSMSTYLPGFSSLDHVGIIVGVNDDGTFTTVEGNAGVDINGEVMILNRKPESIVCAGRPAYGFVNSKSKTAASGPAGAKAPAELGHPELPPGGEYRPKENEMLK